MTVPSTCLMRFSVQRGLNCNQPADGPILTAALLAAVGADEAAASEGLAELFARYNPDVWPGHVIAYVLIVAAIGLLVWRPGTSSSRAVTALIAGLWVWLGIVFHGMYATDLDWTLGSIYAVLFVLQGGLMVRAGILRRGLEFTAGHGAAGKTGWVLLAFALLIYPVIGIASGHGYPQAPLFGMAPCPTTIATFGLLLLARAPLPRHVLVIPIVWAVLGPLGAVPQGMTEDLGLFAAGVLTTAIVFVRDREPSERHPLRVQHARDT